MMVAKFCQPYLVNIGLFSKYLINISLFPNNWCLGATTCKITIVRGLVQ